MQQNDSHYCLQTLILKGNSLGDTGAAAIAEALKSNTTLQELDMSNTELAEKGIIALCTALAECNDTLQVCTRVVASLALANENKTNDNNRITMLTTVIIVIVIVVVFALCCCLSVLSLLVLSLPYHILCLACTCHDLWQAQYCQQQPQLALPCVFSA